MGATTSNHAATVTVRSNIRQEILSTRPFLSEVPVWPYTQLVIDMLYYYAEHVSSAMLYTEFSLENNESASVTLKIIDFVSQYLKFIYGWDNYRN